MSQQRSGGNRTLQTVYQPATQSDKKLSNKSVAIEHNGAVYRLHATKLGKLILTK